MGGGGGMGSDSQAKYTAEFQLRLIPLILVSTHLQASCCKFKCKKKLLLLIVTDANNTHMHNTVEMYFVYTTCHKCL